MKALNIRFFPNLSAGCLGLALLAAACSKPETEPAGRLELVTGEAGTDPGTFSAALYGEITGLPGDQLVDQHGHVWSHRQDMPTLEDNDGFTVLGPQSNGGFSSRLTDLAPNRFYFYRAYATLDGETVYGEVKTLTTGQAVVRLFIDTIRTRLFPDRVELTVYSAIAGLPPALPVSSSGVVAGNDSLVTLENGRVFPHPSILATGDRLLLSHSFVLAPSSDPYFIRPYLQLRDSVLYGPPSAVLLNGIWLRRADFPGKPRLNATSFTLQGKGYVGLGWNEVDYYADFYRYDPATNAWAPVAAFPGGPRTGAVGFTIGNKAVVGLGALEGRLFDDLWVYDPESDTWTETEPFPGGGRADAVAFSIGESIYTGLGTGPGFRPLNDLWSYSPENGTWSSKASMPEGDQEYAPVGFSVNGYGYAGYSGNFFPLYRYDPSADSWKELTDRNIYDQFGMSVFVIGHRAYLGQGQHKVYHANQIFAVRDWWCFDPGTGSFQPISPIPAPFISARYGATGFAIDGNGYVSTGKADIALRDLWQYTP